MYLNWFAQGKIPLDLTYTDAFGVVLGDAADLGLAVPEAPRCVSRNVLVGGLRLHLLEWGPSSGPPVVLLHGGYQSAHTWDLVALSLSRRYRVIAVDLRGHGDSEWPRDREASLTALATDVRDVVEELDLGAVAVIGHSLGGLVLMQLMIEHPDVVRRAVLEDVGGICVCRGWSEDSAVRSRDA